MKGEEATEKGLVSAKLLKRLKLRVLAFKLLYPIKQVPLTELKSNPISLQLVHLKYQSSCFVVSANK